LLRPAGLFVRTTEKRGMKLATLENGTRDGQLALVSRDLAHCVAVPEIARTLQGALDEWSEVVPALGAIAAELNAGRLVDAVPFDPRSAMAPLPRSPVADGSARQPRRARPASEGARPPESDRPADVPGVRSHVRACEDIARRRTWGIDFEAEIAVITGDVPMGTASLSPACIGLMLVNDVSLRNLVPASSQGVRVLPVEAGQRLLAGCRDAGRTGRRVARRHGAPAARLARQRAAFRAAKRRRGHDVRFRR
jgi:2-keto-4-pentenoate hydratase/2-oxohepta-3-ene-1,7-dioic acid hydratase in catechol pathway